MSASTVPDLTRTRPRARTFVWRWRHRVRRAVPFLVWGLGLLAALALHGQRPPVSAIRGIVEPARRDVVCSIPGRLSALHVLANDRVETGQLLATLQTDQLLLRLEQTRAEIERLQSQQRLEAFTLRAQVERRTRELEADPLEQRRRLQRDVDQNQLDALRTVADLEEAHIRLQAEEVELGRWQRLVAEGTATEADLSAQQARTDSLRARHEQLGRVRDELRVQLAGARERLAEHRPPPELVPTADDELQRAPFEWAIRGQQAELEWIAVQRSQALLRAPADGVVESIRVEQGQTLAAGQVVVTLVEHRPAGLVAYLPSGAATDLTLGQEGLVHEDPSGEAHPVRIRALGPAIRRIPEQLWTMPGEPEWALPVHLEATEPLACIPGRTFTLDLEAGGTSRWGMVSSWISEWIP